MKQTTVYPVQSSKLFKIIKKHLQVHLHAHNNQLYLSIKMHAACCMLIWSEDYACYTACVEVCIAEIQQWMKSGKIMLNTNIFRIFGERKQREKIKISLEKWRRFRHKLINSCCENLAWTWLDARLILLDQIDIRLICSSALCHISLSLSYLCLLSDYCLMRGSQWQAHLTSFIKGEAFLFKNELVIR